MEEKKEIKSNLTQSINIRTDVDKLVVAPSFKECVEKNVVDQYYNDVEYTFECFDQVYRDGRTNQVCKLNLKLHDLISIDVQDRKKVNKDVYRLLVLSRNADINAKQIHAIGKVRFLKGENERVIGDDKSFIVVEIALSSMMNPISFIMSGITRKTIELLMDKDKKTLDKMKAKEFKFDKVFRLNDKEQSDFFEDDKVDF